ncbi:hypothetical protein DH2020_010792 [Rehmannia glutinosa]|uniref:Heparanase-like protein 3 n=1 Tax=Rehmannia glutinosa TaxID=99300 RepID=A0ABR0XBL3_REHGL
MVSLALQKGWCILVCVLCFSFIWDVKAKVTVKGTVFIDGKRPIAKTDENFICATLDWWPSDKCDYGICSWGRSSLLDLDLKNVVLLNAIKAFSPLKIRLGGTLQDRLIYQTGNNSQPCIPFALNTSQLFNYTEGCMPLARWDQLNSFFNQSGALITFGLNALTGKTIRSDNNAVGRWNSTNAASLIRYTVKKGYNVYGWELGNELGGRPILGVEIAADPYASDTFALHSLIQKIYKGVNMKPLIMAPGGLFESNWFKRFIRKTGRSLDVITHHIYNLGSGLDENLIDRIVNATVLDGGANVFKSLHNILKNSSTVSWVGESGGVYNSGRDGVTNAFVYGFWYLDQLGLASVYDTKTYCRQTLVGGNYGLLNTTTFVPNPDYYSALLWHRLMGKYVLSTKFEGTRTIRAYAHCAKQSQGVTILLINLDGNTTVQAKLDFDKHVPDHPRRSTAREEYHLTPMDGNIQSRTVLLNGKALTVGTTREEYHLTPLGGDLQSQTVLLNGKALTIGSSGTIPDLKPVTVASSKPITVAPFSIVFVHLPNVAVPACK